MSLGEVLNKKNTYLELKRAEEEALLRRGREEGREEGLAALRAILNRQLPRKFPAAKVATIRSRLRPIQDIPRLQTLVDRLLEDLSWEDFWKKDKI